MYLAELSAVTYVLIYSILDIISLLIAINVTSHCDRIRSCTIVINLMTVRFHFPSFRDYSKQCSFRCIDHFSFLISKQSSVLSVPKPHTEKKENERCVSLKTVLLLNDTFIFVIIIVIIIIIIVVVLLR